MTLQNRVDPWGALVAVADRGTLMGNRGILHDAEQRIVRPWAHKAWVTCQLSFGEMKRPPPFSTTNNYSELFFLDEVTAFAAGHRPCTYCQRERSRLFKEAWLKANFVDGLSEKFPLSALDNQLHKERALRGGKKVTYETSISALPRGTMFEYAGTAYVVTTNGYLPWSFGGYGEAVSLSGATIVNVLTPRSIVNTFAAGFEALLHSSANC